LDLFLETFSKTTWFGNKCFRWTKKRHLQNYLRNSTGPADVQLARVFSPPENIRKLGFPDVFLCADADLSRPYIL
jgi:hypothetical protein